MEAGSGRWGLGLGWGEGSKCRVGTVWKDEQVLEVMVVTVAQCACT